MTAGWAAVIALVALGVAVLVRGFVKGAVQAAREGTRRDLIALGPTQRTAEALVKLGGAATYAFAPPLAAHRTHPWGWLWWCTEPGPDGQPQRAMGWALTYRRARKAAGLPIEARSAGIEFLLSPGRVGIEPRDTSPADTP